ncbi:hypothetical protein [Methylibium petroleiphilum]|uniref:hypothetical protein n=1 Tax=Methylibium petroleiphilum TaxID=105560 RepID=UPI001AC5422C|nr:hypothetical protein [Methylibium petroleiphilum]MBN9204345.1 hypothetical protein [Methylibium petroleiphilum]
MALSRSLCWLPVALLACSLAAVADERPDPLNASAAVPTFTPPSAFTDYRRHSDTKLQSWKDANDAVGRIGGWRAYAREASQASRPANAAPATPAASESTGAPSTPHGAPRHRH